MATVSDHLFAAAAANDDEWLEDRAIETAELEDSLALAARVIDDMYDYEQALENELDEALAKMFELLDQRDGYIALLDELGFDIVRVEH